MWCSVENAVAELDFPCLLWALRPGTTSADGGRSFRAILQHEQWRFARATGRARRRPSVWVTIPYRGWVRDVANFQTNAQNFFDHSCIGSGLCLPTTIDGAKIRGWELTLRSPRIAHRGQIHVGY